MTDHRSVVILLMMENNSARQIEIRKYKDILRTIGFGIAIFGFWSVAKAAGLALLSPEKYEEIMSSYDLAADPELLSEKTYFIIALAVAFFFLLIDLLLRMYIGRSAINASKGRRMSIICILFTCIMLAVSAAGMIHTAMNITDPEFVMSRNGIITSMVIEITSDVVLIEMLIASGRLRQLLHDGGD